MYSPSLVHKNLFNISDCHIFNNTVNSYVNDFTSQPSYIKLDTLNLNINKKNSINITTGDHLPLKFTLYDEFENIIYDISKYYSSLSVKVVLIEKEFYMSDNYEYDDTIYEYDKRNYYLLDSICSFTNGNVFLKK